ncbi:MAG: LysM peptidoglycan-binding domain-containing protein [Flavobacterium sp.]|nr:LysM peptidoglycan-binding domain-containing protein [Flavobacterium sp.]
MGKLKFLFFILIISFYSVSAQNFKKHKVEKGETIYSIAKKYNVAESDIFKLNPKVKDKALQINAILKIPNGKSTTSKDNPESYEVQKGDTFYGIAKKFNISVNNIKKFNSNLDPNDLKVGQKIFLKEQNKEISVQVVVDEETTNEYEDDIQAQDLIHVVKKGETLYKIAHKYQTTIQNIKDLNPSMGKTLPANYQLVIKKGIAVDNEVVEVVAVNEDEISDIKEISSSALSKADLLIEKASQYLGTRYRSGGTTSAGFDCSGLMCTTFKEIDFNLPRSSGSQATIGSKVKKRQAQKGDLIFFATNRRKTISHVGMITEVDGDEIKFIHSSTSSGVIISSIKEPYYAKRFVQINRVLD